MRWRWLSTARVALGFAALASSLHCSSTATEAQAPAVAPARKAAVNKMMRAVEQPSTNEGRQRAVELLRQAVAEDDQLWEAHYNLGVLLARQGQLDPAALQLSRAHELAPNAEDVVTALAEVLRRRDDAVAAVEVLRGFVESYPRALAARRALVVALRESGQSRAALEHARRMLEQRPGDPASLAELALAHLADGEVDVAELLVREALQGNADSAIAQRAAGLIALERGEDAVAFTHFARATELDPDDTAAGLNTATVLLQAGVFEQAEKHFRHVLSVEPDSDAAMLGLAAALRGQGRREAPGPFRAAEKVLRELLDKQPANWVASHNLAVLYSESLDRPSDATARFREFLDRAPADHPARPRAQRWVDDHQTASKTAATAPAP